MTPDGPVHVGSRYWPGRRADRPPISGPRRRPDTQLKQLYSNRPRARILDLSASSLAVSIGGVRRDLVESNVMRIRQRLPDSKKNGVLIGFLVGAAGSTAGAKALESPPGSCSGGCVAVNVLYGGGLGALVGLGIDALIQGRKDIYVRGASRSSQDIVVRPVVTSQAKGLNISLRF